MAYFFLYLMIIIDIVFFFLCTYILGHCITNLLCKSFVEVEDKQVMATKLDHKAKHKIYKKSLIISYDPFTRHMTIICLSLFIAIHLFTGIAFIKRTNGVVLPLRHPIELGWLLTWLAARSLMNSIFVVRLKHSFHDTHWMYTSCTIRMLLAFVIFVILLVFIISCLVIYQSAGSTVDTTPVELELAYLPLYLLAIVVILVIIFYIILTLLFYAKLFQIIKSYFRSFTSFQHNQQMYKQSEADQDLQLEMEDLKANEETRTYTKWTALNEVEKMDPMSVSTMHQLHHQLDINRSDQKYSNKDDLMWFQ
eukprot:714648_1